jgi:hypothetical protein
MYDLLLKLMVLAALAQFGLGLKDLESCHTKQCIQKIEQHSRDVLRLRWKPISVFPEEARRFR